MNVMILVLKRWLCLSRAARTPIVLQAVAVGRGISRLISCYLIPCFELTPKGATM